MKEKMAKLHEVRVGCPDEATLAAYLSGAMTAWERERLEEHSSGCAFCLENIRTGRMGEKLYDGKSLPESKPEVINRAKGIVKMDTRKNRLKANLWLTAMVAAFVLSLAAPRYFAQFLVAALILGLKWVSESESIRTLIIAMDTKRRHEQEKEGVSKWRR